MPLDSIHAQTGLTPPPHPAFKGLVGQPGTLTGTQVAHALAIYTVLSATERDQSGDAVSDDVLDAVRAEMSAAVSVSVRAAVSAAMLAHALTTSDDVSADAEAAMGAAVRATVLAGALTASDDDVSGASGVLAAVFVEAVAEALTTSSVSDASAMRDDASAAVLAHVLTTSDDVSADALAYVHDEVSEHAAVHANVVSYDRMYADMSDVAGADALAKIRATVSYRVLSERTGRHGVQTEPAVLYFLSLVTRTPGECVLWVYTLACVQKETRKPIVLRDLIEQYFPGGLPDQAAVNAVWCAQKANGANLLDDAAQWPDLSVPT